MNWHTLREEHLVKKRVPHLLVEEVPCALLLVEHSLPVIHQVLLIGPDVSLELCSFLKPAVTPRFDEVSAAVRRGALGRDRFGC